MIDRILHRVTPYIGVALFIVAVFIVHRELHIHTISEIKADLSSLPFSTIILGIFLTGVNYLLLTGYDFLALRYLQKPVSPLNVILASLISFSISNNTGQALISGTSMRYRFYSQWGITGMDMIRFSLFLSMTYLLGAVTLFCFSTLTSAVSGPAFHPVLIGCGLGLVGLMAFWALVLIRRKPFYLRGMEIVLPSPVLALSQTLVALIDLAVSALVLYVFVRPGTDISFHIFLGAYITAQMAGLFSQVPGGLGIFEGTFLYILGGKGSASSIFAGLLVFRLVYYFLPLMISGAGLLTYELMQHRARVKSGSKVMVGYLSRIIPHILSILLFLSGGILLISGATPTAHSALNWLYETLPLPIVEASHLLGSVVGLLLLFMARAVRLKIDAAYFGILILLVLGAAASIFKGFKWQEALVMTTLILLVLPTRRFFYRKSSLFAMPFSWPWIGFVCIVLIGSLWIGFFSYRHIEYSHDLWWQFAYRGDAPRFLRSTLLITMLLVCFGCYRLLRVQPVKSHPPGSTIMDTIEFIVRANKQTDGYLAMVGDKSVLFSPNRSAFLMYGIVPGYWIAMGDPVGPPEEHEPLVWQFKAAADQNGSRIAFYQVSTHFLPLYLDLGLVMIKLGEEARVFLPTFDLKGSRRSGLRQTRNKMIRTGHEFRVLEKQEVKTILADLRMVSDAWLMTRNTREKGFSLGYFSEDYISRCQCAAVFKEGKIQAFANLWESDTREELSIDLMRYGPEASSGIMEYLFVEIMLWGQDQGYQWFNLGMSPLSGLETHSLAPLWHKIGNAVFKYSDNFYNFEGLHAYKEKFDPVWQPRYLAAPALKIPFVLLHITAMISGNLKGVFRK